MHENTIGGMADPMVVLVDETSSIPIASSGSNAVRVVYRDVIDIPALLRPTALTPPGRSLPAQPVIPIPASFGSEDKQMQECKHDDYPSDTAALACYSAEEQQKVRKAIEVYHRIRYRRDTRRTPSKASLLQAREIKACLEEAARIDWAGGSRYRKIFLWALPHVLCALHGIANSLRKAEVEAKKQLVHPKTGYPEWETIMLEIANLK